MAVHGKNIYTLKVTVQGKSVVIPQPEVKPKEEPTTENKKVEYATVTFIGVDNEIVCTMEYEKGKPYGKFPKLDRENRLFMGWHMQSSIGKRVQETDICQGDITLYVFMVYLSPLVEETYEIVGE